MDRRRFLQTAGIGVATAAGIGTETAGARIEPPLGRARAAQNFGRLFPHLPAFAEASPALDAALRELGRPGGLMDAHDALERGPVDLIVDPALSVDNPNNPTHTAGTTFMGQFMDHDMTFDTTSFLGVPTPPESAPNARTPGFDLDSVYGAGPAGSPHLYDGIRLRVESSGRFEDVPRTQDGTAIIADPRNDEHVIISGLQSAFLCFHNRAVDLVEARDRYARPEQIFARARRLTTWHYQWMILHEFLPLFVGETLTRSLLWRGRRVYGPKVAFIPIEFQGAAYRFGHSMVRPSYRANLAGDKGSPFFGLIFDPAAGGADPSDLRGGARAPRRFVGWQTFYDFGDGQVKPNKLIDTRISTPLFDLPLGAIASHDPPTALAQRNLLRQLTWKLPSGQTLAKEMGVPRLSARDLGELGGYPHRLDRSTPLWYYVLKEAELIEGGRRLGPVGARIVGEVIVGLLELDPAGYLTVDRGWRPTLPSAVPGDFRMTDFLRFAGVDPASRGQ
jgi:Animal haem peroxidase